MGASNVVAAYQQWAGQVPPLAMQLLAFMAVVSRDDDERPWFGQGHEALALHALGRPAPIGESDLRAVRRGITALLDAGAIEPDRRAAARRDGPSTVRYRLRLVALEVQDIDTPPVDNPPDSHNGDRARRTESGRDVGRFVVGRRTENDRTPDGNRPTEEPRGTTRSEEEEDHKTSQGDSLPSTGTPTEHKPAISDDESGTAPPAADPDVCPGCGVLLDPGRTCGTRLCVHFGERLATVHPIAA